MKCYVIRRGECNPSTPSSTGGKWESSDGPQSWRPLEVANLWVNRWAIEKPPLPSNCVNTIITCLKSRYIKI